MATAKALLCGIAGTEVAVVGGGPLGLLINFLSDSLGLTMSSVLKDGATYQMGKTHPKSQPRPRPRRREWHQQTRHAQAHPERPQRARLPRAPCWTCREEVLWWPCHTSWLLPEYDTSTTPCNSLPSRSNSPRSNFQGSVPCRSQEGTVPHPEPRMAPRARECPLQRTGLLMR